MDVLISQQIQYMQAKSASIIKMLSALCESNSGRKGFEDKLAESLIHLFAAATQEPMKPRELSTEEIVRIAAAHYVRLSSALQAKGTINDHSELSGALNFSLPGLTLEETKNVELTILLLSTAEMVDSKQYHQASTMVAQCNLLSSRSGNPVQRLVFYYSIALQERIDRDAIMTTSKRPREPTDEVLKGVLHNYVNKTGNPVKLPFSMLMKYTSIQTIIDNVGSARKIHMIDLFVSFGHHWTVMMQALAMRLTTCPIDYLKITAIAMSEQSVAETGKMLVRLAESLGLPFVFKTLVVGEMGSLKENMFEVREGETLGVYASMFMNSLIARPDSLDNLMRVLLKLKPCIMTITGVEAKINSPSFIKRFAECLFYQSALFDCLDGCMDRNDTGRMIIEGCQSLHGMKSITASDGSDRMVRHVGISVWKAFFGRYGLIEAELSDWSAYQASLVAEQFNKGGRCTLVRNGKSFMVEWKGTALFFISAWKFQKSEGS